MNLEGFDGTYCMRSVPRFMASTTDDDTEEDKRQHLLAYTEQYKHLYPIKQSTKDAQYEAVDGAWLYFLLVLWQYDENSKGCPERTSCDARFMIRRQPSSSHGLGWTGICDCWRPSQVLNNQRSMKSSGTTHTFYM